LVAEMGSIPTASATTHSRATVDFLTVAELPAIGGLGCPRSVSAETRACEQRLFGRAVSGFEIPFPGKRRQHRQRLGSNVALGRCQAEHAALAGPFGGQFAEPCHAHAMWQATVDGRLDEIGREEGK
jgi:hypothetical protein